MNNFRAVMLREFEGEYYLIPYQEVDNFDKFCELLTDN
jgi:hypothetical protein